MKKISQYKYKDLDIGRAKNGQGIFVLRDFKKGEKVFEVKGVFISGKEEENIDEKKRSNSFRYDKDSYISPEGEIGDFLNHSCEPNAKVSKKKGKLYIVAIDRIGKSQEVTIDYSTILANDDIWEMHCKCGSTHCRKKIKRFNSLPNSLKEKYISLLMVPRHILHSM
jgi:SET domain-containing protein